MSDFNIFGQDFDGVVGFKLTDTNGTLHTFSEGGGGTIWQDENGQVHFSADGINTVEQLTVTENGTYTNPSGSYNPVIVNVAGGGSGDGKQIKFIDYDGEIIEEYTLEEFQAMDGMPANPSHAGLVAQGWNWDRQEVFDYLEAMPDWPVVVGQMYVTESGKTEIDIELPADALSPWLLLYKGSSSGSLDIDWGDGSTHDTVTNSGYVSLNHNYSNAGKYTIKISAQNVTFYFTQGVSSGTSYVGFFRSGVNKNYDSKYASTIKAIRLGNGITTLKHVLKLQNLEYITIPSTITLIYEIIDCYSLKGLVFPKNITSHRNLQSTIKLKNVSVRPLSSNLVVRDCISLKYYTCPSKLTTISNYNFQGCNNLSFSALPTQVKTIGTQAFQNCYQLTSINLPSTTSQIGTYAFASCVNLSSINIPSTVSSIGQYAFQGCGSLDSIDISATPTIYPYTFQYCRSLSSISFCSALTSIGNYAFANCSSLSSIDIPSTVSSIGGDAFYSCTTLQSISIPSLITTIWPETFWNCNSLSSIDIPSAVSSIGNYAFYCDYSLPSINLPSALASIGHYGFASCRSLSSITIPALTTYLGNQAFYDCLSMQEYHFLPTTPPTIGTNVFQGIPSTCKIYVPYSSDHSILNAYQTKTNWATWSSYMVEEDA